MSRNNPIRIPFAAIVGQGLLSRFSFRTIGFIRPLYAYRMILCLGYIFQPLHAPYYK